MKQFHLILQRDTKYIFLVKFLNYFSIFQLLSSVNRQKREIRLALAAASLYICVSFVYLVRLTRYYSFTV